MLIQSIFFGVLWLIAPKRGCNLSMTLYLMSAFNLLIGLSLALLFLSLSLNAYTEAKDIIRVISDAMAITAISIIWQVFRLKIGKTIEFLHPALWAAVSIIAMLLAYMWFDDQLYTRFIYNASQVYAYFMIGFHDTQQPGFPKAGRIRISTIILATTGISAALFMALNPNEPGMNIMANSDRIEYRILGIITYVLTTAANGLIAFALVRKLVDSLESQTRVDALTGLNNRRHMEEEIARHWSQWKTRSIPFSLLVFDIDFFKVINDSHGHAAGDMALKHVAEVLRKTLRAADVAGRFGGDEFIVVIPGMGTGAEGALGVAERVREALLAQPVPLPSTDVAISISAGVATVDPLDSAVETLLERADGACYCSKRSGRGRVSLSLAPSLSPA